MSEITDNEENGTQVRNKGKKSCRTAFYTFRQLSESEGMNLGISGFIKALFLKHPYPLSG